MLDPRSSFRPLATDECLQRLADQVIGRVCWAGAEGIQVLPVTYALRDQGIVFRTAPYGILAELREPQQAAFEIDTFDTTRRAGWSVVVHGRTRAVADPHDLVELWGADDPVPWAPGTRNLFIAISLDHVSGRVVAANALKDE